METCQICFDQVDLAAAPENGGVPFINGQLCGAECPAKICQTCLLKHLRVSLNDCYAGILPRVRCPICLTRLNKTQWLSCAAPFIKIGEEDAFIAEKYANFCRKACSFQTPCCHKVGYTHLPEHDASSANAVDGVDEPTWPEATDQLVLKFLTLCREFCFHRADGRTVIQFAIDSFATDKADAISTTTLNEIVEKALLSIIDDERRAALLLSYLYLRPAAITRCCKRAFCFNCKRNGHHDKCDTENIREDNCVAQCRSCRVTIIKVEGCDSVTCVCGFSMSWGREIQIQKRNKRKLIAVDIFDRDLYKKWDAWRQRIPGWFAEFQRKLHERHLRKREVWLAAYTPLLRRGLRSIRRKIKAQRAHEKFQRELFWKVYDKIHACEAVAQEVNAYMKALCAIDV